MPEWPPPGSPRRARASGHPRGRLPEKAFQGAVIDLAHLHGWRVAHFTTSQVRPGQWATAVAADGKGFPDLVIVKPRRLIFAELKGDRGRLTPEQKAWLSDLATVRDAGEGMNVPLMVCVWRPNDWPIIEAALKG